MDQIKIGKFIAEQRKLNRLTQQQLGDKLGVTNKTISRWENGNYMPDIEMMQLMSRVFTISINEILAGEILSDEQFRKQADENIVQLSKRSIFSFKEKRNFWISKWRKEHVGFLVALLILDVLFVAFTILIDNPWMIGFLGLIILAEYGWQNNRMMIYVENHLYEKAGDS